MPVKPAVYKAGRTIRSLGGKLTVTYVGGNAEVHCQFGNNEQHTWVFAIESLQDFVHTVIEVINEGRQANP